MGLFGLKATVEGIEELEDYTHDVDRGMTGRILQGAFERGADIILSDAQRYAPVDKGELRSSLDAEIEVSKEGLSAIVFSDPNVVEPVVAAVMELGSEKRWWPPIDALRGWAARHGMKPYLVAKAIHDKGILGGAPGYQYMRRPLEKNENRVVTQIARAVERLLKHAG